MFRRGTVVPMMMHVLALSLGVPAVKAQGTVITYYHGNRGESRPLRVDFGNGPRDMLQSSVNWVRPAGEQVCVDIVNAHPVFYAYSLTDSVFELQEEKLPDVTLLVAALNALLPAQATQQNSLVPSLGGGARAAFLADATIPDWIEDYSKALEVLREDIDAAQAAARTSDRAEPSGTLENPSQGYRSAQWQIQQLPAGTGRFNSPSLEKDLEALYNTAVDDAKRYYGSTTLKNYDQLFLNSLRSQGEKLLTARNGLVKAYQQPAVSRTCATTSTKGTLLRLRTTGAAQSLARDTGKALLTLSIRPRYNRPRFELAPMALMAYSRDVPSFSIIDGKVAEERTDDFRFRAGALLLVNLRSQFDDSSLSYSLGPGFAFQSNKKVLSDLFLAGAISFRDQFRIGIGAGLSDAPARLKSPARVGEALPANAGELSSLVETRHRFAVHFLFALPGLKL